MTKRFGFTLAEVLITLGIIGVVAAMTMPTLINQTNGAQYKAAYKKALSAISQAVTLNVALDDISFADTGAGTAASLAAAESGEESIASLLNKRMNVVDNTTDSDYVAEIEDNGSTLPTGTDAVDTFLYFNDSSMFAFKNTASACTKENVCRGYVDVNGKKGPNKVVECDTVANTANDTYTANSSANPTATATACTVSSPADIYPVVFFDQTIQPLSNAAKAVLYGK